MTLPANWIERLFFLCCLSPYLLYFAGLASLAPSLLALILIGAGVFEVLRRGTRLPMLSMVWMLCCVGILVEEIIALNQRGVGLKHLPWWFLTYGLAAFLPMVGSLIRPAVISTAAALLGLQTLIYVGVALACTAAGIIESVEYGSLLPSSALGNKALLQIHLLAPDYAFDREWRLVAFAPYTPFAGATAILFSMVCLSMRQHWVKWLGLCGWLALLICTHSRMGIVAMSTCCAVYAACKYGRRYFGLLVGLALLVASLLTGPILHYREKASSAVHSARLNSSQDRENLRSIAWDNWLHGDHPLIGAGESAAGGKIVNQVYIGDLDSLGAILFVRGALGLGFTLLPILLTMVHGFSGGGHPWFRSLTCIALGMLFYCYSQSLKDLFPYFWPALLFIGSVAQRDPAHRPHLINPQSNPLPRAALS